MPQEEEFYAYRRRLPHWRMEGATYFITWRLDEKQSKLTPDERSLVQAALRHFDGERYELLAYVVMDDHVHALINPLGGHRLQDIVHSWKSFTARVLQRTSGRQGRVWQDEYFDRIVRDEAEYIEKATYILNNPWKRWPGIADYPWVKVPSAGS